MKRYWLIWFIGWFTTFIVPELIAIARSRTQDTLSGAIWQLEQVKAGRDWPWQWTLAHILFTGAFIALAVWLTGHFGWGIWRF